MRLSLNILAQELMSDSEPQLAGTGDPSQKLGAPLIYEAHVLPREDALSVADALTIVDADSGQLPQGAVISCSDPAQLEASARRLEEAQYYRLCAARHVASGHRVAA